MFHKKTISGYHLHKCYFFFWQFTSFFALVMRLIDLLAIGTDFEISQGFHTDWRSHQWRGNGDLK